MTRPMSYLEQQAMLLAQQRLAAQAAREAATRVRVPTLFLRDPVELVDRSGIALQSGCLQSAYEAARREKPRLTIGEFLAGGGEDTLLDGIVDALLGPASATMLRTTDPAQYREALRQAYHDFQISSTPFDGGVAYSQYRYQTGRHLALPDTLNVVPMNAPTGPDLHYPPYGPLVTSRGHRSIGMVMASRAWGRDITLDARGVALFRELGLESRDVLHGWDYDPDFMLSEVQIAHMISTGSSPMYQSWPVKGQASARAAEQARWELAARLGDESILEANAADLQRLWSHYGSDTTPRTGDRLDLATRYARDPYYRLSRDDLFEMALQRPGSYDVEIRPYEWEHGRPQRFTKKMLIWVRRLRNDLSEVVWGSRLSMLTGASEPANLQLLSPWQHARVDLQAGRFHGGKGRLDRYGNRAIPTLDDVKEFDEAARAAEYQLSSGGTLRAFPLTDELRADEPIIAFDQHTLAELASTLHEEEWQNAVSKAATRDRGRAEEWNQLVDRFNAHLAAYGMPAALNLPRI